MIIVYSSYSQANDDVSYICQYQQVSKWRLAYLLIRNLSVKNFSS